MLASWVSPTPLTTGQDHQATRAMCEVLYGQLLPGITNVTDRGRYFSLYPWLLWAMDQESLPLDQRTEWLRRADCLFTLIGLRHGQQSADPGHSLALVGNSTLDGALRAAEAGEAPRLSTYATQEEVDARYFKNRRGGLGQYYLGSLELLRLLGLDDRGRVTWTRGLGEDLAKAADRELDRAAFFAALAEDEVDPARLDALSAFCPCQLSQRVAERDALLEVLLGGAARDRDADPRRHSLGLLLDLAPRLGALGERLDPQRFRGISATGTLPDGSPWALPPKLEATRLKWATYQRNEWLSVALQGVLWASLRELEERDPTPSVSALTEALVAHFVGALDLDPERGVRAEVEALSLPDFRDWTAPEHELGLATRICEESLPGRDAAPVMAASLQLLLALLRRGVMQAPYAAFSVAERQLQDYPANLAALPGLAESWAGLRTREWLAELISTWGVQLHLSVALRKMRQQGNDTFRIRPTDRGLRVEAVPQPTFGNPRFVQAVRVLRDLGLLLPADAEAEGLTPLGTQWRERLHG
ncbi:MAG: hypothetical protein H6741_19845 [Alphaproteobacteria bacterium]|nr:hypothetical protein [Alphaproteobacteria bacterium]MCB9794959.1 hypothetical protein [Alphaproteobacteria bacterium]